MKLNKLNTALACLALVAVAVLVACDTGSSPSGGRSGVSVYLTDTPLDLAGVHAVNVTLSEVSLYPSEAGSSDEGGLELESGPISLPGDLTLNLLDFRNGQEALVGSQTVPAGSYNRLRLKLSRPSWFETTTTIPRREADLVSPSRSRRARSTFRCRSR
jgi:hypothetical protein